MKMNVARRLSEAVGSWLHLEFCCYRAGLFSESSLKTAVGSVLSSFPIITKGARVHADFPHAALNPVSKGGRKREIDFALILSGNDIPKNNAEILVETKWADSSHCNSTTIFQDFLRLAILKAFEPSAVCVFILAGTHESVAEYLALMPFRSKGKTNTGISASDSERRLKLDHTDTSHASSFATSIGKFVESGFSIPESFVTRSNGLHPVQSKAGTVGFQAIAWEVVSVSQIPINPIVWGLGERNKKAGKQFQ